MTAISFMMTSSNGNIFRITGPLCGEFTGPGEFPTQRPVTRSFDVFFDLRLNKRLSKQSWGWWFETLSCSLWRHRNGSAGPYSVCRSDRILIWWPLHLLWPLLLHVHAHYIHQMVISCNRNIDRITSPLWRESTGDQRIPLTNGLWYRALINQSIIVISVS